jgi:hypothetical protein
MAPALRMTRSIKEKLPFFAISSGIGSSHGVSGGGIVRALFALLRVLELVNFGARPRKASKSSIAEIILVIDTRSFLADVLCTKASQKGLYFLVVADLEIWRRD